MARRVSPLNVVALAAVFLLPGAPAVADTTAQERVVITDLAGRQVSIPKTIKRVVPLG